MPATAGGGVVTMGAGTTTSTFGGFVTGATTAGGCVGLEYTSGAGVAEGFTAGVAPNSEVLCKLIGPMVMFLWKAICGSR